MVRWLDGNQVSLFVGGVDTPNRPTCVSRKSTGACSTPTGGQAHQKMNQRRNPRPPIQRTESEPNPLIMSTLHHMKRSFAAMHPFKIPYMIPARTCIISSASKETRKDRRHQTQECVKTCLLFYQPPHLTFFLLQLSCIYSSSHSDATLLRLDKAKERKYRCNRVAHNSYRLTVLPTYRLTVLPSYLLACSLACFLANIQT